MLCRDFLGPLQDFSYNFELEIPRDTLFSASSDLVLRKSQTWEPQKLLVKIPINNMLNDLFQNPETMNANKPVKQESQMPENIRVSQLFDIPGRTKRNTTNRTKGLY